jgi:RNA recognition motif-containing protein
MKLFVAGLPYDFDSTDLKEMFELYGEVASAKTATDRETGKSKGFGFVDMPNDIEAKEAIQALHDAKLRGGKQLVVKLSDEQGGGGRSGPGNRDRDNRGGGGFNRGGGGGFNKRNY